MSTSRSDDMVEQVLFDILLNLPVMSLLRFKAVCKDWFSLIESSTFVSEHFNHHRDSKEDNLITLGRVNGEPKFALLSGSQYEECVYDIENWQCWHFNDVCLLGYCDGIVCLGHGDEIALWNPALNQLRPLPPSLFSPKKYAWQYTSIGIDIKSNDYKLVRICLEYRDGTYEMIGNRVEVYNLAGDNSWRIIHEDDVLPFCSFITFVAISSSKSGMCFWIAYRYDFGDPILLSFDFNEDLFRTILLPHEQDGVPSHCCQLDLLRDKVVCIMEISSDDKWNFDEWNFDKNFEIWMLHEFGVEDSWNKIYKIGPMSYPLAHPLGISKNGEFLICCKSNITIHEEEITLLKEEMIGKDDIFYLHNLHTQQGKFRQNCNLELCFGQLIHYNASLLSLKSANSVVRPTKCKQCFHYTHTYNKLN